MAMHDANLLHRYGVLARACSLARNRGERSSANQLLAHATRGITICQTIEAIQRKSVGSVSNYVRILKQVPKPFLFWSNDIAEAGEAALNLASRTVQIQNCFGQIIWNIIEKNTSSPKSFSRLIEHRNFQKWDDEIVQVISRYWDMHGKHVRSIRDHEQHYPIDLGNCWVNFDPLPSIEIEYPLDKDGVRMPLLAVSKRSFWELVSLVDTVLELTGVEVTQMIQHTPAIDLFDQRLEEDGIAQIIEIDSAPEKLLAFIKIGSKLQIIEHNLGTQFVEETAEG